MSEFILASIAVVLMALLIVQHFFWSEQVQLLTNKLMCRNYFEYQQAEQAFKPAAVKAQEPEPEEDMDAMAGMGGF